MKCRFPVTAPLDSAGGKKRGTVEIDRETNMVRVRPHRARRTYDMSLEAVATIICRHVLTFEEQERRAKKAFKKPRVA